MLMNVKEIQEYLRVGKNVVYSLLNTPNFPKVKIGREYRVKQEWLDGWLEEKAKKEGTG